MTALGHPIVPAEGEDLTQYDPDLLTIGIRAPHVVHTEQQVSPLMREALKLYRKEALLFGKRGKRK